MTAQATPSPRTGAATGGRAGELPRAQGDEARLFERYQHRLLRVTSITVSTSEENVDDACAFAWSQLLARQPRRESIFAWLRQVARREAIRLDTIGRRTSIREYEEAAGGLSASHPDTPVAAHRSAESAHAMVEVRERLAVLPDDQREIAFMRAAGWRYRDIADCLDITQARVNKLLARADAHMRELDQRDTTPHCARAERLQQLEADPPAFLLRAIGRLPRADPKRGGEERRLEWRRLALAVDDYRAAYKITDPDHALGSAELEAAIPVGRASLEQRIAGFSHAHGRSAGRTP